MVVQELAPRRLCHVASHVQGGAWQSRCAQAHFHRYRVFTSYKPAEACKAYFWLQRIIKGQVLEGQSNAGFMEDYWMTHYRTSRRADDHVERMVCLC